MAFHLTRPLRRVPQHLALAVLLAASCAGAAAASDASANRAVLDAARAEEGATIKALERMVKIESGSNDHEGLGRMADYVRGRLQELGAQIEVLPAANGQPPGLVKGTFTGSGKLRILLIAHLDTVYHRGILETEPWRREGNQLFGPGIADAKGGVATILHALEVLKQTGWDDYATMTVLFNADEEIGSPGSGEIIADLGSRHDVVLSYEPSPSVAAAGGTGVLLQTAGTATARLTVEGRAAHAGAAAGEGRNALIELADQILKTDAAARDVPHMQLNWTMVSGGAARNQIPASAEAIGDVRISSADGADQLMDTLTRTVAQQPSLVPDTTTHIELHVNRPMFEAGERGLQLAHMAQAIYHEIDGGKVNMEKGRPMPGGDLAYSGRNLMLIPGTTGGTDAGFAARSGVPAVLESLGLAGWGFHAKNEYVEVDSIVPRLYLTARMLMELGQRAHAGTLP